MHTDTQPLREIRLTGDLGGQFGRVFRLAVDTPAEAIRALCVLRKGFRSYIEEAGREFKVLVGDSPITEHDQTLHMHHGPGSVFVISPVLAGSKSEWASIIVGATLITLAFMAGPAGMMVMGHSMSGMAMSMGMSMVIGGIAQLMAPTPKQPDAPQDGKASYLFNGPVQTTNQSYPVPVGYGELIVGGAVISAGVWSEDLPK